MTPEHRKIGRTDLTTGRLSLGAVTFGREIDEETSRQILDYAVERDIRLIDAAEAYGGGNSQAGRKAGYDVDDQREVTTEMFSCEKIIGRWIRDRGNRDEVLICTKVSSGNSPENIRAQVQASLERLMVDRLDIYMLHNADADVPIEEALGALAEQMDAGNVGAIGCSNLAAPQLQEALAVSSSRDLPRFEAHSPPYNLGDRSAEPELLPLCRREEIATLTYSPLAAGFLAGKYQPTEDRHKFPKGTRFDISPAHADIYFSDRNFRVLEKLRAKAAEMDESMVYLAMAWVLGHPDVTSVLVGARHTGHIENAIRARDEGISQALRDEISAWD